MEEVKQILVVDDHFEMLEFLRSMLELSNHEYQVLGVPSAEEGLLELRRTPFDLLITDVRLPGMSGFELARKVKKLRADIPIIMITGYSSEQGKKEASEVGVMRYFKKPLDTDALLAAVHTTLYGAEVAGITESVPEAVEMELPADVRKRLETLRSDTGARQVMLSTLDGQVLYEGGSSGNLALSKLAGYIADSMRSSFLLAEQLSSPEPFSIQYQAGQRYDLYSANVGLDYFVAIFFDAQARRGRLGTIWVFAQRAINDLQTLLADHKPARPSSAPPADSTTLAQSERVAQNKEAAAAPAVQAEPVIVEEQAPVIEMEPVIEVVEEAEEVVESTPVEEIEPLTLADIQGFLGIEAPVDSLDVDLDSFWDDALVEEMSDSPLNASGMSLEEARKKGLIPTEFDQPGHAGERD